MIDLTVETDEEQESHPKSEVLDLSRASIIIVNYMVHGCVLAWSGPHTLLAVRGRVWGINLFGSATSGQGFPRPFLAWP